LDLEAVIALNTCLQTYPGTLLLVTHDEDLIDEVATRIWDFKDGGITDFQGVYSEYQTKAGA
jgi:ATPase subunit of ABC transporter with duplicated ATPase domains